MKPFLRKTTQNNHHNKTTELTQLDPAPLGACGCQHHRTWVLDEDSWTGGDLASCF